MWNDSQPQVCTCCTIDIVKKKKELLQTTKASSLAVWVQSCFNIWCKLVHLSLSFPFSYWPITPAFLHCYDNGAASGSPSRSHTHGTSAHSHKKEHRGKQGSLLEDTLSIPVCFQSYTVLRWQNVSPAPTTHHPRPRKLTWVGYARHKKTHKAAGCEAHRAA